MSCLQLKNGGLSMSNDYQLSIIVLFMLAATFLYYLWETENGAE